MSESDLLGIAILACYLLETSDDDDDDDSGVSHEHLEPSDLKPSNPLPVLRTVRPAKRKRPGYSSSEFSEDEDNVTLARLQAKSRSRTDHSSSSMPPKAKSRRVWCRNPNDRNDGICAALLLELSSERPELNRNFAAMSGEQFDHLLELVKPHIEKLNTNMRMCISASDRLVLTLRFLAAGESFRTLNSLFRIPHPTISTIIPRVLDAIYTVLADEYVKVTKHENIKCMFKNSF